MKTPPFAAALTAVLITLAGGPMGLGEAHARAIYTGTFDPNDDDYEWNGTHKFGVSESCLTSDGWRAANTGYGGSFFNYDGYTVGGTDDPCEAQLLGGTLSLRRLTPGKETPFYTLTFGEMDPSYIWGVYVKDGKLAGIDSFLTGRFRFTPTEEAALFDPTIFSDGGFSLRWESGKAPLSEIPEGLFAGVTSSSGYVRSPTDPVYLYMSLGNSTNDREVTPGVSAQDVKFSQVPEPGSIGLAGLALAGLAWLSRRRSKLA